jgi:hypothetical protein
MWPRLLFFLGVVKSMKGLANYLCTYHVELWRVGVRADREV